MKECIICRIEKDDSLFNDEHVIPDSLQGYYHIKTVCTDCNSMLGSTIDSKLVNHTFSDFQRFSLGTKGKSGKVPNPFSGRHSLVTDPDQQVHIKIDDEGKTYASIIPKVVDTINDGTGLVDSVSITIDASDESKLDGMIKKKAKRLKLPVDAFNDFELKRGQVDDPRVTSQLSVDLNDFKLGLLKIAYEFAVDTLPDYYPDKSSVDIANMLYTQSYDRATEFVNIGSGFQHEILEPFNEILDFEAKRHHLILFSSEGLGLICIVQLYKLFSVGIRLSEESYASNSSVEGGMVIIGVNDLEAKTFTKISASDLLYSQYPSKEVQFGYFFKTQTEANEVQELLASPDFCHYEEDGCLPFFDSTGELINKTLDDMLFKLADRIVRSEGDSGEICESVDFDEELYIKALPSNRLIQVVKYREFKR